MATAISVANFEAALGNCYDAISAGNYASAWKYYAMAEAQHSGLVMRASQGSQGSAKSLERRNALDGLRKAVEAAQIAGNQSDRGGGFVQAQLDR